MTETLEMMRDERTCGGIGTAAATASREEMCRAH